MKIRRNIAIVGTIIILTLSLGGLCVDYFANRSKKELERQVIAMDGMSVNLSFDNAEAVYNGIDSVYVPTGVKKLVLFVDSSSCSGCFLSRLISYYGINDSLVAHGGEMLVLLHPRKDKLKEVRKRLKLERFPFWCIVDKEGEFVRHNPDIPDNWILHTFILDENNNVMLVGDPTTNVRINELLCKKILR